MESLLDVDSVPPTYPMSSGTMKLIIFEDNESVIKMVVKGRSPAMGHVSRTHRIDLDWLFERCRVDPSIKIRFVPTKAQLADMLTKGSFTAAAWGEQCRLWEIGHPGRVSFKTLPEKDSQVKKSSAGKMLRLSASTCLLNSPGCRCSSFACACIKVGQNPKPSFYPLLSSSPISRCMIVAHKTLKQTQSKHQPSEAVNMAASMGASVINEMYAEKGFTMLPRSPKGAARALFANLPTECNACRNPRIFILYYKEG